VPHGALRRDILAQGAATMTRDVYIALDVMRVVGGAETRVFSTRARLANTTTATTARDARSRFGESAARQLVLLFGRNVDIRKGDDLWGEDGERYRVQAVDVYLHGLQAVVDDVQ